MMTVADRQRKMIKTWFYKNGLNNEPVPVVMINSFQFNSCCVIQYQEINKNGMVGKIEEYIGYNGDENLFGENLKPFPEIRNPECLNIY